ncbi:sulfate ABC transporter permease subunit CysT [Roseococcus sp. SYP-B2431]|uniref:sulfate ABC transporter permease subunit CysT n=1 Tax=Roseococcus sp. SYP-B2431 TaxID=2496640 RepID=UPI00103DB2E5|nr:sulfate ABC transporter permease subunit CysT [Roseococcus sp. SYP-B2431]TCH97353.1 sulfate ABC transporter permease subunit CysT [Roseococcus sp. SYP-B2431]
MSAGASLTPGAPSLALRRRRHALPGLGVSLGLTLAWLGLIVLIPLAALAIKPWELGPSGLLEVLSEPRVLASLRLSFGAALLAALVSVPLGLLLAWTVTRYRFPGRRLLDALVDLPFALPTAVAGLALTALFAPNGWLGAPLAAAFGWQVAFKPAGVVVALVFVALPFVVRSVEPVLRDLPLDAEEAAATLGATRLQTIRRVVLPALLPATITGFGLGFARAVGEYGSVIFIAGNMPMVSEIAPLLIVVKLEQFNYAAAAGIGLAMLLLSFAILLALNLWQRRLRRGRA